MNYNKLTKEELLTEIDNKSKAIINMGKQQRYHHRFTNEYSCFVGSSLVEVLPRCSFKKNCNFTQPKTIV